jgi:predicted amidohydrolase
VIKVALVQYDPVWENKQQNRRQISQLLESISDSISLIVLPELTLTAFTMRSKSFAEPISGDTVLFFGEIAKRFNAHVIGGFIEEFDEEYFNTLVQISPDGLVAANYHKVHPFSYSSEQRFYQSGLKPVIGEIGDIKIGFSICYDLRFPELFRHYAKNRTQIIVNIANWPVPRIKHWSHLLIARAIENQSFLIGVNRIGKDKKNIYNGRSAVIDPIGETIVDINDSETVAIAEIDVSLVEKIRKTYPFLEDIRLI